MIFCMYVNCTQLLLSLIPYLLSDSGSVVSGDSEEWSQEDMAQAIRIDSELQQTGMYFA